MSETGTATVGITVERTLLRNAKTTRVTRAIEIRRVTSTSLTDDRIVSVRSSMTVSAIVGGSSAWSCGMRA